MGREYHSHNWPLAFVHNFHGPSPKIRRAALEKGIHHYTIRKKHCSGMHGRKVGHIAADFILKILIWPRQVKVKSRHDSCSAQRCTHELVCRHRPPEPKALHHIKAHLTHGEIIGAGLNALSYGASAKAIGKLEDLAAVRLFQAVVSAADDELLIDLDLDDGKVVKSNQRRPLRPKIVNRDCDVAEPNLPCHSSRQVQVMKNISGINLNDKPSNAE
jgi:hypothetical protein